MKDTFTVYLSLGSNLGNRLYQLQKAVIMLGDTLGMVSHLSAVYETPAWGFDGAPFLNACLALETSKSPEEVLKTLLMIEKEAGRFRGQESGYVSRTLDIDIVYYGEQVIATDNLIVPHPHMEKRWFVLKPLADIAPQFYHPILNKDTRNLLQECKDNSTIVKTSHMLYPNREEFFSQLHLLAIEGNIGVGKTTLAKKVSEEFNAKLVLERFADNPFLPKFYKDQARYAFPLEMSFLADRYQQYTDDTRQFDLFKKFMVSDYDIYKSLIFAKVTLGPEEYALYRKLFTYMYKEVKKPDLYIYLHQDTKRLLENIKKRGRDYEQQIAPQYLEQINKGYVEFLKTIPEGNRLVVDVTNLDFVDRRTDYERILDTVMEHMMTK
ncbi:2-amino-4-hydroxy-6-hydroxymethyldihydropteridine diphosphokinase [Lentiprolixibacter aurantiacus]|uniref:2-amino-4-hydroxy-6-hydroxymethyldihydropteridine pyrophosphokinase n=1 Tax=Lentiprolixibacter aurantiacus TaxID=2993939 RepID=A0AAE3MKH3_9FLAO|nr:2-amino-4-hydroxy-6-hydroxymethyldihydropteridine diphosphokinase [Lentiprolixibacter aurantiacus]MCX2719083.1 2-amino-4-hydroxy-6-hydroxymethyldihydropteridine diphosphokinase [Lentiprolixibacter aurantiacus]